MMQWVTKFSIQYSRNGQEWISYGDTDGKPVFDGNKDQTTAKENIFAKPFCARFVRIYPKEYYAYTSMRADFVGC